MSAGYVLAEITAPAQDAFVRRLWEATRQVLVLVEPGTPDGFARLKAARTALIAAGAHVAAPCTHEAACPMAGEEWCRFLVRVQRSRDHRLLKQGERPFEDEPYAYLAVMREKPAQRAACRIVGGRSRRRRGSRCRFVVRMVARTSRWHAETRRSSSKSAACGGEIPSRFSRRSALTDDRSLTFRPSSVIRSHVRDRHPRPTTARPPPRRVRARPSAGQTVITAP